MVLYAAKLKESAKKVSDLQPPVDKKEAAKLKRQENARLKKEAKELELANQQQEAQRALAEKENELKAAEEALKLKKETQKEKRRLAREAKKVKIDESVTESATSNDSTLVEEAPKKEIVAEKKTRKRKQVSINDQVDEAVENLTKATSTEEEPPAWFRKYVTGVKNEESQHRAPKKPKKQVVKEANQVATEQWGNGLVRDRVRNEVDQHMSRMYQMIFNRGL